MADFDDIQDYLQKQTIGPTGAPYYVASNESLGMGAPDMVKPSAPPMTPDLGQDSQPVVAPETARAPVSAPASKSDIFTPSPETLKNADDSEDDEDADQLSKYRVTPDDYRRAAMTKLGVNALGGVGDALSNFQGWGNFFLGRMNPKNDSSAETQAIAATADAPIQAKQAMMKQAVQEPQNRLQMIKSAQEAQQMKEMQDPDSPASKLAKSIALSSVAQIDMPPELKLQLTDAIKKGSAMSVHELVDSSPLLKESFTATIQGKKMAQTLAIAAMHQETANSRLGNQQDKIASEAANKIHSDPAITQMLAQARNVDKGMNLMNDPNHPPSVTTMNEIAQDYAAALSGNKGVASDAKIREISTPTLQGNIARLKGMLTSNPDQPAPPEVVKFWSDMGQRLRTAYDAQMSQRAAGKLQGLSTAYAHNPNALKAAQEAAATYRNGAWRNIDGGGDSAPSAPQPAPQLGNSPLNKLGVDPSQMSDDQKKAIQNQAKMELLKRQKTAGR